MAQLFEGNCNGKAVKVEFGANKAGKPTVKWEMEVADGPHVGKRASYSGKLDEENIKWTKRDMMLIGWKGKDVRTFVDDVNAAGLTVPFEAQIATNTYQDSGKTSQWTTAKFSGGAKPLAALDPDKIGDVNKWFAEAPEIAAQDKGGEPDIPF